jgi:hypothetical protein
MRKNDPGKYTFFGVIYGKVPGQTVGKAVWVREIANFGSQEHLTVFVDAPEEGKIDHLPSGSISISGNATLVESGFLISGQPERGRYEKYDVPANQAYTITITGHDSDGLRNIQLNEYGVRVTNIWGYGYDRDLTLERTFLKNYNHTYQYSGAIKGVDNRVGWQGSNFQDVTVNATPVKIYVNIK